MLEPGVPGISGPTTPEGAKERLELRVLADRWLEPLLPAGEAREVGSTEAPGATELLGELPAPDRPLDAGLDGVREGVYELGALEAGGVPGGGQLQ
jgi:hypothetical protein